MTGPFGTHGSRAAVVGEVSQVLRAAVDLLRRVREVDRADWLADRLRVLESATSSDDAVRQAFGELHGVVLGMGGMIDLEVQGQSPEETEEANTELNRLADQLYELTRA